MVVSGRGRGETANICQSYLGGLFLLSVTALHWAIAKVKWGTRLIYKNGEIEIKFGIYHTKLNCFRRDHCKTKFMENCG